jgi:hypothetical protein
LPIEIVEDLNTQKLHRNNDTIMDTTQNQVSNQALHVENNLDMDAFELLNPNKDEIPYKESYSFQNAMQDNDIAAQEYIEIKQSLQEMKSAMSQAFDNMEAVLDGVISNNRSMI